MIPEFWMCVSAGFIAQLIDGALGMAYGVTASSLLLAFGVPPAAASATVHAAECFTTGASAISHHAFQNIDRALFRRLLLPGIMGAIIGATILSTFSGDELKPYVAVYLLVMGVIIVSKAFRELPPRAVTTHVGPLGFVGALLDAMGGGGWGPVVASTLMARGHHVRTTVGTVNAVEFFVTVAVSVTFFLTIGLSNGQMIAALALGGLPAAPIGAWVCRHFPVQRMMVGVGLLVIALSLRTLLRTFGAL
ncbi:MAG: sulfite exporter TauE/SafE family protein [Vicinamibacteria bacterium]